MSEYPEVLEALKVLLENANSCIKSFKMPFGFSEDVEVEYKGKIYQLKLSIPIYSQVRTIVPDEDK